MSVSDIDVEFGSPKNISPQVMVAMTAREVWGKRLSPFRPWNPAQLGNYKAESHFV